MSSAPKSKITIIAVAVSNYHYLTELPGAIQDVEELEEILVYSEKTALFSPNQFIKVTDPSSSDLREVINDYVRGVSKHDEILIFYFSGHGTPISDRDFGLCTIDSVPHPTQELILPLSVVKFSDLLLNLNVGNITPIIIIDACYSGFAGKTLLSPSEVITSMRNEIHMQQASKFALLTSCNEIQESIDTPLGGIFSQYLVEIARGIYPVGNSSSRFLSLQDIFPELEDRVMNYTGGNVTPRLFLGPTLPKFNFVKNVGYSPNTEILAPYLIRVLKALWSDGNDIKLSPRQIDHLCGKGAYGNNSKLCLKPWALIEKDPETNSRRLTQRGKEFMLGKVELPKKIEKDQNTGDYKPAPNTNYLKITDYK
ncbi:MAG: caspase family protein [Anaerolineales bacterium]|jgi:hypothetical protein